jgi:putative photosynthetic complex assembly protein
MSAMDKEPFPKSALIAAGALIGFSLIVTAVGRFERLTAPSDAAAKPHAAPVQTVDVRFIDEPNGSVSVLDSRDDKVIASLAPGTNGFVRSVMRGLVHDRKRRGLGAAPPFRISEWAGGRIALEDTATGRLIDLDAFGDTNKDAFAQMLPGRRATS